MDTDLRQVIPIGSGSVLDAAVRVENKAKVSGFSRRTATSNAASVNWVSMRLEQV